MKILNRDIDKSVKNLLILLTPEEAIELRDGLEHLISENISQNHVHFNDFDFKREITVAIYNRDNDHLFDNRTKQLISEE